MDKLLLIVASLAALWEVSQGACTGTYTWCEMGCTKLSDATVLSTSTVTSNDECKTACESNPSCMSINYKMNETKCEILDMNSTSATTTEDKYYTFYEYVCDGVCPEPEPDSEGGCAEPESEEDDGDAEVSAEEFWEWLRDEPQWFALIGMGVVVILMFIIIVILICRLKGQK